MNHIRIIIANLFIYLPYSITDFIYQKLLKHIQKKYIVRNIEAWGRNSISLKYLVMGLSDLDLSLLISQKEDISKKLLLSIHRMKKSQLGGETHFYVQPELNFFKDFGNKYELKRDPHFIKKICHHMDNVFSQEEAITFILKMVIYEKDLGCFYYLRHPKWKNTFELIQQKYEKSHSKADLIKQISNLKIMKPYFSQEKLMDFLKRPSLDHELGPALLSNQIPWSNNQDERVIRSVTQLEKYSTSIHGIIYYWQRWEIWGLYTILPMLVLHEQNQTFEKHIHNQRTLTQKLRISNEKKSNILTGYNQLLVYYQSLTERIHS